MLGRLGGIELMHTRERGLQMLFCNYLEKVVDLSVGFGDW
jgi:hypothetical protein